MNKVGLIASSLLIAAAVAASAPARAAYTFMVTVTGQKQGKLKGDAADGRISATAFSYSIRSPRDPASGQATGKRQHSPISFTKAWGASSPQLFSAIVNNENLTSVLFEFSTLNSKGVSQVYETVKLTNANVSGITRRAAASSGATELEDVSLTFQKIEIEDSGILAGDDWSQVN